MTTIEIILLIIGMLFLLGSFWVTEKLSPGEIEHISELSKEEMGMMLERELENSKQKVVDIVEETIDASKERTERALEKQTNEKIMAIDEYSDTVIEKMNKTHNEIMFLYSMLNDKHTELTDFSNGISKQIDEFKSQADEMADSCLGQLKQQAQLYALQTANQVQATAKAAAQPGNASTAPKAQPKITTGQANQAQSQNQDSDHIPDHAQNQNYAQNQKQDHDQYQEKSQGGQESPDMTQDGFSQPRAKAGNERKDAGAQEAKQSNVKDEIIKLYEEGKDSVAIAKRLGMGVGEVRLILGLYKGEHVSEV